MTHSEKEGFVLFFLNNMDSFLFARRLGVSHARLCRWYRGAEEIDRKLLKKALSVVGSDEETFGYLVSRIA